MLSFDDAQQTLTEIADRLPQEIFRELNGGILLLPEVKQHPQSIGNDLYILGEYHYDPRGFGRYVTLYYGSFQRTFRHLSDDALILELQKTLYHELTHHLEGLAGDRSLEIEDELQLQRYRRRKQQKPK